jgi:hypothetical protein
MPGAVEQAIRRRIAPGTRLPTPTDRAEFIVGALDADALILLLGPKRTRTPLTWSCLEGIPGFLRGQGWVRIGANRDVLGEPTALDGYLKRHIRRQTADYVAVVLEYAGVVVLNRERPARVRLR